MKISGKEIFKLCNKKGCFSCDGDCNFADDIKSLIYRVECNILKKIRKWIKSPYNISDSDDTSLAFLDKLKADAKEVRYYEDK